MNQEYYFCAKKYKDVGVAVVRSDEVKDFDENLTSYSEKSPSRKIYLNKESYAMNGTMHPRYVGYLEKDFSIDTLVIRIEDKAEHFVLVGDAGLTKDINTSKYDVLDEFYGKENCSINVVATFDRNIILKMTVKESKKKGENIKSYEDEVKKVTRDIIDNNILSVEELDEREMYLAENGISPDSKIMVEYLKLIRPQKGENIRRPKVVYQGVGSGAARDLVKKMIMHLTGGGNNSTPHNIILQGAKSTGKNVAWESIAWLLNAQIIPMTCSNRMTRSDMFGHAGTDNGPKEKITSEGAEALLNSLDKTEGYKWIEQGAEFLNNVCKTLSPALVLNPGPITKAMQIANDGNGVILLLNEFNYSDPNTIAGAINDLIDRHSDYMYITDLGNVPISDKLIVGATQNQTGGDYIGTQEQNDALMSRFCCISLESGSSIAPVLTENHPEADEDVINLLDNIYNEFYGLVLNGVSESCLNIRGFIAALESIEMGEEVAEAVKECVINTVQNYDDWSALEEAVDNIIE